MITCDFCNSKIDRHAFCNSAHKMQYHRIHVTERNKAVTTSNTPVTQSNKTELPVTISNQLKEVVTKRNITLCEHGSMKGLCKKGC